MSAPEEAAEVIALVQRCLAGSRQAWDELCRRYQPYLLRLIARMLHRPTGAEVVEDIADRVWEALWVYKGYRLRCYDPRRGKFTTFLGAVARQEESLYCRRRQRELQGPQPLGRLDYVTCGPLFPLAAWLAEFADTLSPAERRFFEEHLLGEPPEAPRPITDVYGRKLKQRINGKLRLYLADE